MHTPEPQVQVSQPIDVCPPLSSGPHAPTAAPPLCHAGRATPCASSEAAASTTVSLTGRSSMPSCWRSCGWVGCGGWLRRLSG
jgi:hypothetical protein